MDRTGKKNITFTQRLQLETMLNCKMRVVDIAKRLGLSRVAIYKEIKRGLYEHRHKVSNFWYGDKIKITMRYSADKAQARYKEVCGNKGRALKIGNDFDLIRYIDNRVYKDKLSACAVLGEIKHRNMQFKTNISKTTLYRYIEMGLFEHIKLAKRKQTYRKQYMKRAPKGTSIEKRPIEIKERKTFGHWEMDCVCGSDKAVLLVLSERLTRKEIIFKMENQKAVSVVHCLNVLEKRYGKKFKQIFKSITIDNGSEFADYLGMEKSIYGRNSKRTQCFYCHPYCSCERGTNERLNREIRRLIPKGRKISLYSNNDIQFVENWVNNYPRQVLGFATSQELFDRYLMAIA